MRTAEEKEQDRHGGYMPIIGAAIRHVKTGYITPGVNHQACRVSAYRIATGDTTRTVGELMREWPGVPAVLDVWLEDQPFEDGFINSIGMFFDRAHATQIVSKLSGIDTIVAEMSCREILAVGLGIYKSGGALPPDNKVEIVDVEDEW